MLINGINEKSYLSNSILMFIDADNRKNEHFYLPNNIALVYLRLNTINSYLEFKYMACFFFKALKYTRIF